MERWVNILTWIHRLNEASCESQDAVLSLAENRVCNVEVETLDPYFINAIRTTLTETREGSEINNRGL